MAVQGGVLRGTEDDDDDDGVADLFDAEFVEHMEALKQACQMLPGAEVRLKSTSILAASKFEEEEFEEDDDGEVDDDGDDDDDDDALLFSIERKFVGKGGLGSGLGRSKAAVAKERSSSKVAFESEINVDDEERQESVNGGGEDKLPTARRPLAPGSSGIASPAGDGSSDDEDEDLLRSVRESCWALDLVKAAKHAKTSSFKAREFVSGKVNFKSAPSFSGVDAAPTSDHGEAESMLESGKARYVNVDVAASVENVEAKSHLEEVDTASNLRSFLPAQLNDDEEFGESPFPPVIINTNFDSNGSKAEVPENVQAVTGALLKNRKCQQTLRELLRQVEAKLNENKEMQRRAVSLVEYQKACNRKFIGFTEVVNASVELIATKPPSRRKTGEFKVRGPPDNPDVETFRKLQAQLPAEFNAKKWTKKESQALAKGVRQQLQEICVRAIMESWDFDDETQDFDEQMRRIGENEEELKKGLPSVDWNEVARIYVSGRSPWECKLQWENNEDPLVNCKPWSKSEDKKLLSIAQAHEMVGWTAIAKELGTQRTPAQCAMRYQRSLNAAILRSAWTPEEDEQLQTAVEKFGEKDWQTVAACMEGRLGSQCMSRWTKVLHPDRHRRGRWLADEDTRLKWAVSVYGPRGWKNIAAHVPGRSDVQCRERWCNVLDPAVKIDDWSREENTKLEDLVAKHGRHRWAAVGAELGRTDNQCFRHWKLLHPEHRKSFKKDMVIRRAALATNFVGREKERPDLGFHDFLPPSAVGEKDDSEKHLKSTPASLGAARKKSRTNNRRTEAKDSRPSQPSGWREDVSLDVNAAVTNSLTAAGGSQVHANGEKTYRRRRKASQGQMTLYEAQVNEQGKENSSVGLKINEAVNQAGRAFKKRKASQLGDKSDTLSLKKRKEKEGPITESATKHAVKTKKCSAVHNKLGGQELDIDAVVLSSSNGLRRSRASEPGEGAFKKKKAPETAVGNSIGGPEPGSDAVALNSLNGQRGSGVPKQGVMSSKKRKRVHLGLTIGEEVESAKLAAADGRKRSDNVIKNVVVECSSVREHHVCQSVPIKDVEDPSAADLVVHVSDSILDRTVVYSCIDVDREEQNRDTNDTKLIVYTRRKRHLSNPREVGVENVGTLSPSFVGLDTVRDEQVQGLDAADTLAPNALVTQEPTLKRYRKKLTLPDFVYNDL